MANAGYSRDKKVLTEVLMDGKILQIKQDEHPIHKMVRERLNNLMLNEVLTPYRHNGKKYYSHSSLYGLHRLLIKLNQLRMQNWFWERFNP